MLERERSGEVLFKGYKICKALTVFLDHELDRSPLNHMYKALKAPYWLKVTANGVQPLVAYF